MVAKTGGTKPKIKGKGRGFAAMSKEERTEIARKGGIAAHTPKPGYPRGRGHLWTPEEAQRAGQHGGTISRRRPKTVQVEQASSTPA